MKKIILGLILSFLNAVTVNADIEVVGGGLLVAPTKVIFKEGQSKSSTLSLINRGGKPSTYRIAALYKVMNPDGTFTEIPAETAENPLGNLVRFSPRQVTILPGQTQKVRVMLRSTARLEGKEFSSRLLFRAIPDIEEASSSSETEEGVVGLNLTALYGVSVPVMYWPKETRSTVSFENLNSKIVGNKVKINFDLNLAGNKSNYQDVKISWQNPDGNKITLEDIKGVYIYYPQMQRKMTFEYDTHLIHKSGKPIVELSEA